MPQKSAENFPACSTEYQICIQLSPTLSTDQSFRDQIKLTHFHNRDVTFSLALALKGVTE